MSAQGRRAGRAWNGGRASLQSTRALISPAREEPTYRPFTKQSAPTCARCGRFVRASNGHCAVTNRRQKRAAMHVPIGIVIIVVALLVILAVSR